MEVRLQSESECNGTPGGKQSCCINYTPARSRSRPDQVMASPESGAENGIHVVYFRPYPLPAPNSLAQWHGA